MLAEPVTRPSASMSSTASTPPPAAEESRRAADAVIPFGRYVGCTLRWLADNQMGYLRWLDKQWWLSAHPQFEEAFIAFREANPMLFVRL